MGGRQPTRPPVRVARAGARRARFAYRPPLIESAVDPDAVEVTISAGIASDLTDLLAVLDDMTPRDEHPGPASP